MKQTKRYIEFLLGVFFIAFGFNVFLLPNDIVAGGVSGLSIITKRLFDIDPSLFILITSLILLFLSAIFLGKKKTIGTIIGSLLLPVFIKLTENIGIYLNIGQVEPILSSFFGGAIYGLGLGLTLKAGFTTGGTDIINQITNKYLKISMGTSMLINDGIIVLGGAFAFGINKLMYALITLYVVSLITDKVLLGISQSKAFQIVTTEEEKVKELIIKTLGHGVTVINAKGGYDNKDKKILLCVVPNKEYFKLKEGIEKIDKDAFFVITDSYEVHGGE